MKYCSGCETEKQESEFHKHKRSKDGLQSWCKCCFAEYNQSHKIEIAEQKRGYRRTHKAEIVEYNQTPERQESLLKGQKKHRERYPKRIKARNTVNHAIRDGILIRPTRCDSCNKGGNIQAHHESYEEDKWLVVDWLCEECHREADKSRKNL